MGRAGFCVTLRHWCFSQESALVTLLPIPTPWPNDPLSYWRHIVAQWANHCPVTSPLFLAAGVRRSWCESELPAAQWQQVLRATSLDICDVLLDPCTHPYTKPVLPSTKADFSLSECPTELKWSGQYFWILRRLVSVSSAKLRWNPARAHFKWSLNSCSCQDSGPSSLLLWGGNETQAPSTVLPVCDSTGSRDVCLDSNSKK